MLTLENITVRYGEHIVADGVSFDLRKGQWLMLVGPNGAGKSTLINTIAQSVPYRGIIRLDGLDIRKFKPAKLARKIGVLSQHNHVGYAYTVGEIVNLGRYAHSKGFLSSHDDDGEERVAQALKVTGMEAFRDTSVLTLSGGELQRAFLAQVFAQAPQILLLDEPANHLDLIYQKHVFSLVREWLKLPGRAVISVVHDLSLARMYGTHAVLMHHGRVVCQGATADVLTPDNLERVYEMNVYDWMRELLTQWQ